MPGTERPEDHDIDDHYRISRYWQFNIYHNQHYHYYNHHHHHHHHNNNNNNNNNNNQPYSIYHF